MRIVREELPCHTTRVLVLTGQTFDPAKAVVMGVVDEVVDPARVGPRAIEMAATMAAFRGYGRIKAQFQANAIAEITRIVETNDERRPDARGVAPSSGALTRAAPQGELLRWQASAGVPSHLARARYVSGLPTLPLPGASAMTNPR